MAKVYLTLPGLITGTKNGVFR